ncbi:nudix domain [Trichoderma cornu-damae]|uniref:Nudix domain n=1 Tax=Trichoderma cornu-damae TaxID=654480 RepID=A0A9P8QJJ6_9HYPO|nr:nudix domain [Trichoderma cornu-damae]
MAPYTYTTSAPLAPLASQPPEALSSSRQPPIARLMTSVLVLRQPRGEAKGRPRVLLLRRSPADSYPLKWEAPGGSVDASDASLLDAAARELWEETGLRESRLHASVGTTRRPEDLDSPLVANWGIEPEDEDAKEEEAEVEAEGGGTTTVKMTTFLETGETWGKVSFLATASESDAVATDPREHVEWGWFTEEEVRTGERKGGGALEFTSQAAWGSILESFRIGRELGVVGVSPTAVTALPRRNQPSNQPSTKAGVSAPRNTPPTADLASPGSWLRRSRLAEMTYVAATWPTARARFAWACRSRPGVHFANK